MRMLTAQRPGRRRIGAHAVGRGRLLKGACERVRKAEGDLEAALSEEQAARRLISVRKDFEVQLEKLRERAAQATR